MWKNKRYYNYRDIKPKYNRYNEEDNEQDTSFEYGYSLMRSKIFDSLKTKINAGIYVKVEDTDLFIEIVKDGSTFSILFNNFFLEHLDDSNYVNYVTTKVCNIYKDHILNKHFYM